MLNTLEKLSPDETGVGRSTLARGQSCLRVVGFASCPPGERAEHDGISDNIGGEWAFCVQLIVDIKYKLPLTCFGERDQVRVDGPDGKFRARSIVCFHMLCVLEEVVVSGMYVL